MANQAQELSTRTEASAIADADLMPIAVGGVWKKITGAALKGIFALAANKDATGGYAGLTLFKINFKNAANTFTSFFTNSNTAARTYTFQDRDGTVAFTTGATATLSSSAGVVTINCADNTDQYELALTENITSWVFNNPPAAGTFRDIQVRDTQHATAAKTVVSPATAGRTAGGVWVQSTVLNSIEMLSIRVYSDGTRDLFPSGVYA